jgi:hypothetical protein
MPIEVKMDILKIFGLKREQTNVGGSRSMALENRSYDELLDEITDYHVSETRILEILREKISTETLKLWSEALDRGIKSGMTRTESQGESEGDRETLKGMYQFILDERIRLLPEQSMKNAKKMGPIDPVSVCIVCGIRALQKEKGLQGLMSTMKFKVMERYFA